MAQDRERNPGNDKACGDTASRAREEFDQLLLATGRLSQLPDTAADYDDPEEALVELAGEPLSETVIRERR